MRVKNLKLSKLNSFWKSVLITLLLVLPDTDLNAQFLAAEGGNVTAELVSEVKTIQPGKSFWVAVHLSMEEDWHTYWRYPGDSGLPTSIKWDLPEGFSASGIHWPLPERIDTPPLISFGYHDDVYLLTEITVPEGFRTGENVELAAHVEWLECREACLPGQADVSLTLPVTGSTPEPDSRRLQVFADARSDLPLRDSDWQIEAGLENGRYIIRAIPPDWFEGPLEDVAFFPYAGSVVDLGKPQTIRQVDSYYLIEIEPASGPEGPADTLAGILVSQSGWRGPGSEHALEINATVQADPQFTGSDAAGIGGFLLNILFSFLGGIILNLMPCVLPVLSIKIMGFVQQANDTDSKPWQHGVVFMLGVLVSFWILAGALLILQAGGEQLGWGFQLQSPAFLILLSAFMFLFGLSMFGVFEIGTSLSAVGGKSQSTGGWMGSFVSGITATVVATPCTAPFMGSALGFALSQPAWVSMTIFTFLGLGMAFPYVLLSSIPSLLKFVPKPGRWMESLKQFMGFLLLATVLWLLWVLSLQAGAMMVIIVLAALLFLGLAGWVYGRWGNLAMPPKTRMLSTAFALILIIGSIYITLDSVETYAVTPGAGQSKNSGDGIAWQPFSPAYLDQLKTEGKPVFLDFTAAWCLSCQVNERVAFSSEEVQQRFDELGIVPLKADWTSRDETITQALARYGRNSVPLYVYYAAGEDQEPVILPEIITPGIVLEALE